VYDFAEGSRDMRDLLGGKGAGVAEMTRILGPTWSGRIHDHDRGLRAPTCVVAGVAGGPEEQVGAALAALEKRAGKRLGDAEIPLLVSVRSGARESMPG
jgi:pyruvate,orthophosphate dikinase